MRTFLSLIAFYTWVAQVSGQPESSFPRAGYVIGWGGNVGGAATGTPSVGYSVGTVQINGEKLSGAVKVAAGLNQSVALAEDGKVVCWGGNENPQSDIQNSLSNIVSISSGGNLSLALNSDGHVFAWGKSEQVQLALPEELAGVVAIAAGDNHSLALTAKGEVFGWPNAKTPEGLSNVVAIAAGSSAYAYPSLALKRDGTLVYWGASVGAPPENLSNITSIALGNGHGLALHKNGTVMGWGLNYFGQATGVPTDSPDRISSGLVTVKGQVLSNVVAIAASKDFSMALKSDGSVVAWGGQIWWRTEVPVGLSNVVAISAGPRSCLAITTNAAVAERFIQKESKR